MAPDSGRRLITDLSSPTEVQGPCVDRRVVDKEAERRPCLHSHLCWDLLYLQSSLIIKAITMGWMINVTHFCHVAW